MTDTKLDDSVLIEEADPEAIRLDDLESNASVDEDAVPMRKVTANNKVRSLFVVQTEADPPARYAYPN
jgi:hypothetical protein